MSCFQTRTQPMSADLAGSVGRPHVTVPIVPAVEVMKALRAASKASHLAGMVFWLISSEPLCGHLAAIMADVITVIRTSRHLPVGFWDGIIAMLYKNRGDLTPAASSYPVTSLCTDYHLTWSAVIVR